MRQNTECVNSVGEKYSYREKRDPRPWRGCKL